jgi:hypothetical protein
MRFTFKTGSTIYHESRYWKLDNLSAGEVPGWNVRHLPYVVVRVTEKTIYCTGCGPDGQTSSVQLPRGERPKKPGHARHEYLEADGRQYHSRFHEYFYAEIPTKKQPKVDATPALASAWALLGISPPYSDEEVKRAYKRKATKMHPDAGGSHDEFIRLQKAREVALRRY